MVAASFKRNSSFALSLVSCALVSLLGIIADTADAPIRALCQNQVTLALGAYRSLALDGGRVAEEDQ